MRHGIEIFCPAREIADKLRLRTFTLPDVTGTDARSINSLQSLRTAEGRLFTADVTPRIVMDSFPSYACVFRSDAFLRWLLVEKVDPSSAIESF
jgi:hypothetical protein